MNYRRSTGVTGSVGLVADVVGMVAGIVGLGRLTAHRNGDWQHGYKHMLGAMFQTVSQLTAAKRV